MSPLHSRTKLQGQTLYAETDVLTSRLSNLSIPQSPTLLGTMNPIQRPLLSSTHPATNTTTSMKSSSNIQSSPSATTSQSPINSPNDQIPGNLDYPSRPFSPECPIQEQFATLELKEPPNTYDVPLYFMIYLCIILMGQCLIT